jgi:hypothetical protein
VMSAPGGAAEAQYDQNIRAGLPSPFPGPSARGFSPTQGSACDRCHSLYPGLEVLRHSTEGRSVQSSGVSRRKLTRKWRWRVPMSWQLLTRWQQNVGRRIHLMLLIFSVPSRSTNCQSDRVTRDCGSRFAFLSDRGRNRTPRQARSKPRRTG